MSSTDSIKQSDSNEESKCLIAKPFLEKILQKKVSSFKVSSGSNLGDNYLSVILSIEVNIQDDKENHQDQALSSSSNPLQLIAKLYPASEGTQTVVNEMNVFWKEVNLYREYLPDLITFQEKCGRQKEDVIKLAFPQFIAGAAIDNYTDEKNSKENENIQLANYLVMIDAKKTYGFKMLNKRIPLDFDHISLAVKELAKIHAVGWAHKQKENLPSLVSKYPYLTGSMYTQESVIELLQENFALVSAILKATFPSNSRVIKAMENLERITPLEIMLSYIPTEDNINESRVCSYLANWHEDQQNFFPDPWIVPCHGDCWINNFLFKYSDKTFNYKDEERNSTPEDKSIPTEIIFVDLQLFREGCPSTDLAFLIYTSCTGEFIKAHSNHLLRIYYDQFVNVCQELNVAPLANFTMENLQWRFKRSKIYGFMSAAFYMPIRFQSQEDTEKLTVEGFEAYKTTLSYKKIADRMSDIVEELLQDHVF